MALAELNGVLLIIIGELGWPMHVISDVVKLACRLWILNFSPKSIVMVEKRSVFTLFFAFSGASEQALLH